MTDTDKYDTAIEKRLTVLGTRTPKCACGETHPFALTGVDPHICCYECAALAQGKTHIEQQHVQGQHNGQDTVPMLGNDHRVVDARKRITWPQATLRNPDANPLLRAAAYLRGWLDMFAVAIDRGLGWIPEFLENLAAHLDGVLGAQWWLALTFAVGPS